MFTELTNSDQSTHIFFDTLPPSSQESGNDPDSYRVGPEGPPESYRQGSAEGPEKSVTIGSQNQPRGIPTFSPSTEKSSGLSLKDRRKVNETPVVTWRFRERDRHRSPRHTGQSSPCP